MRRRSPASSGGAHRLAATLELAASAHTAAIVVSDVTRPCPSYRFLPALLAELASIPPERITILFALGGHRGHTPEEQAQLVGQEVVASGVRLLDLDAAGCVPVGTTSRGTRLEVFEPYLDADLRICTGNIEYHYFAGFSGGAKAVVPGLVLLRGDPRQPQHDAGAHGEGRDHAGQPRARRHRRGRGHDRHRLRLQRAPRRGQADHPGGGWSLPGGPPGGRRGLRPSLRPAHLGGRRRGDRLTGRHAQGHQSLPGAEDAGQRGRRGAQRRRRRSRWRAAAKALGSARSRSGCWG